MKKPNMILFDYGDTLCRLEKIQLTAGTQAVLDTMTENPKNIAAEEVQELANQLIQESNQISRGETGESLLEIRFDSLWRFLNAYFSLGFTGDFRKAEEIFWDHAAPVSPTPHIQDLLSFLSTEGIPTGVISNLSYSGITLQRRLQRFFPQHIFSFILSSCDYGFRKPHPFLFRLGARLAGLPPEDIWFCGDNFSCDVEGSAACGMVPIWYGGNKTAENRISITDWEELMDLLRRL